MRVSLLYLIGFVFAQGQAVNASELQLKIRGENKSTVQLFKDFKPKEITVFEPKLGREVTYVGVPVRDVFDKVYGKDWRREEEVLISCKDGFQPSVPVGYFLGNEAYLVFKKKTGPFKRGKLDLGPHYLVWGNKGNKKKQTRSKQIWPYQVTALDLIRFEDRFSKILPAAAERPKVMGGFLAYRRYCMSCHSLNGQGGKKATDLSALSVRTDAEVKWLKDYISDPEKVSPGVKMPALNPQAKNRDRVIADIVRYLQVMTHK